MLKLALKDFFQVLALLSLVLVLVLVFVFFLSL